MKRTLAEFGGREGLLPAERKLLDEVHTGLTVRVSPGVPPETPPDSVKIRASFLRYLALGGCEACHPSPKGVRVQGAYVEGDETDPTAETKGLDLEGATLEGDLGLIACFLPDLVLLRGASLPSLNLQESRLLAGLNAQRLTTTGSVILSDATVEGEVRLLGAKLGGSFEAFGVSINGAMREEVEDGQDGQRARKALVLQSVTASGGFFLRRVRRINGWLDLRNASFGYLADEAESWPAPGSILINGFTYKYILAGPVDAKRRLAWLALQDPSRFGQEFWPQPYEQLAKVFRAMGHGDDARAVLIEKERLQRADRRTRVRREAPFAVPRLDWFWDGFVGATVAYGHSPLRAGWYLAGLWLLGLMIFTAALDADALKPNDAFTLRSPDWVLCATPASGEVTLPGATAGVAGRAAPGQSQFDCFAANQTGLGYPTFKPWVYSLDTLLPVVEMEMQQYWIPDERFPMGAVARVYLWLHIALGWALSLLAVAGFSGLIKSD